jgi:hypothetical protein
MARVAPIVKNGASATMKNESPSISSQVERRLSNLEKQMDRALKMLEVITMNTNPAIPRTPIDAHLQKVVGQTPQVLFFFILLFLFCLSTSVRPLMCVFVSSMNDLHSSLSV